ncbi:plasmolipin-like [Paramacrobiotus metropolitanus]|uniref:plasmolipin-like n=1 Tax=Paramacrobiotus metropolitanus TaxID=2943436 RepID=UPI002445B938|nr:plasmolipin-like [Paramacrobiotus metropolitanus]
METNGGPSYQHTTVISTSYNDPPMQPSYYSGESRLPETPVKSTRIVEVDPYFDVYYLKTFSGILKIIELVCTLIAFIISVSTWSSHSFYGGPSKKALMYYPYAYGSAVWTDIVTAIAFLITLALLILYLFHIIEKLYEVPWLIMELLYCIAIVFCLLIAGAVMIPYTNLDGARGACVFFCWAAMIAYAIDAYLKFRMYRNDQPAQGV